MGDHPSVRPTWECPRTGRPLPFRPCSGWGLPSRPGHPGRWCALTAPFHPHLCPDSRREPRPSAVCSLWHFPAGRPDWPLASILPCGAPTFLSETPWGETPRSPGRLTVPSSVAGQGTWSNGNSITTFPWRIGPRRNWDLQRTCVPTSTTPEMQTSRTAATSLFPPTGRAGCNDAALPWVDRSACRGLDATIFYPDPDDEVGTERALAVCGGCDVQEHCLEHALSLREHTGIWGGATERDRRRILRRRRRSA